MLDNYEKYLYTIQEKLDTFFERQKDYIFCREGCAKCCKNAQFPFSEIEYKYLIEGFKVLPDTVKDKIKTNVKNILVRKQYTADVQNFKYDCPFLVNNTCAVYSRRGLICRIFGLLSRGADDNSSQMPFCIREGLNYSNVYDSDTDMLSVEKYERLGLSVPPAIYNIDYKTLIDPAFGEGFGFKFGNVYSLIEHIEKDPLP